MLGGQLGRDLLLGAPQDERPQRARQRRQRLRRPAARAPDAAGERARAAEHAGVQELEQRPQLAEVVLDRRARQRQPMAARAAAAPPSPTRESRVLDRLRLVEDDVVELDLAQQGDVACAAAPYVVTTRSAPASRSQVGRVVARSAPTCVEHAQLGREARRLLLPVARPATSAPPRATAAPVLRRGRRAPRAAPAPAPSCRAPCRPRGSRRTRSGAGTPASRAPSSWYGRSCPRNVGGAFSGADAGRTAEARRAPLREHLVDRHLGLRREQRVEQSRLRRPEAEALAFDGAQLGQRRVSLEPLLRQHAEAAVAEHDHRSAPRRSARSSCGQRRRSRPRSRSPACRSNQSTPLVTDRLKRPACRYSFPSASTRQPAATRRSHRRRQPGGRNVEAPGRIGVGIGRARRRKPASSRARSAAASAATSRRRRRPSSTRGIARSRVGPLDDDVVVQEREIGDRALSGQAPGAPIGRPDLERRPRRDRLLAQHEIVRELEARDARQRQQPLEEWLLVGARRRRSARAAAATPAGRTRRSGAAARCGRGTRSTRSP